MSQTAESTTASSKPTESFEELRESARTGQHAAIDALRKFNHTLDEAIPEAVHPLRAKVTHAAIELASTLAAAQSQFHRNLIRGDDRALTRPDQDSHGELT